LVLTAPNRTEKEVGLYTDGGPDCNGDMQPIVHLSKTQVFQLARNIEGFPRRILERVPTGDLKTPPDEVALGAPFPLVDLILAAHIKFGLGRREIVSQLGEQFEKYASPLADLGYTDPALVVDNIIDAYDLSRDKGRIPLKVKD
jgi:NH3-dependent NAD+ synthetase